MSKPSVRKNRAKSAWAHVNSRASVVTSTTSSSTTAASSSTAPSSAPSAAAPAKPKIDIKKMFQNPSSAPSSNPPSDTSSPPLRVTNLPSQSSSPHQNQLPHPQPSQLGAHSFTTFVPSGSWTPQHNGPNGGPPRSPSYPPQMNGNGPRPQGNQNSGPPTGLSSPRLGPYMYPGWYPPMPMQPPQNHPSLLQNPGTATMSHALPHSVHGPNLPPSLSHSSNSIGGLTSPPPSSAIPPSNRLSAVSSTSVPRKITLRYPNGVEMNLENLKNVLTTSNVVAPSGKRPTSVRIESVDQRNQRLAGEEGNEERLRKREEAKEKARLKREERRSRKPAFKSEARRQEEEEKTPAKAEQQAKKNSQAKAASTGAKSDMQDSKTFQSREEDGLSSHFAAPVSPTSDGRSHLQRQKSKIVNLPAIQGLVLVLNKLTLENLDSISDQIMAMAWVNNSKEEMGFGTLFQVIRLIFMMARYDAARYEMYAHLCRKIMERINSNVQDDGIKDNEGKLIAGGQLFRRYLLNRCQEDFECVWVTSNNPVSVDGIIKSMGDGKDEPIDQIIYQTIPTGNRTPNLAGLGLMALITELFKLQMLPECFMYECLEQLLVNVGDPVEAEIESLCRLLMACGSMLDKPKARAKLDACFARFRELARSPNVSSRTKSSIQSVIELRESKWMARILPPKPSDISFPGEVIEAQPVTPKPAGGFAGKMTTGNNQPILPTNPSSDVFLAPSSQPGESSKTPTTGTGAEAHFNALVAQIQWKLVEKLVSHSTESRSPDAKLVASFFSRAVAKDPSMASAFEEKFAPIGELINDLDIDLQGAVGLFASLLRADSDKTTGSDLTKYRT